MNILGFFNKMYRNIAGTEYFGLGDVYSNLLGFMYTVNIVLQFLEVGVTLRP